ncbi:hypothetical protein BUALT_Bualt14G0088900 [Buddleja alternifolia]|uniref:GAG-pre-integrase domain-containing protein n=1 Tax=Buddleja alternifolia TaxID=168488 RepID=A0AAV6WT55_9LAMI|nr:hypothetical protein BUALT_Bualt14G0088900 [Buddleja alternifolia]
MSRAGLAQSTSERGLKAAFSQFGEVSRENNGKEKNSDGENNKDKINVTHEDLLFLRDYDTVNLAHDETTWVIDNGASIHVTYQRDIFTSYTPGKFEDVRTADHEVIECICVGEICLETSNGSKMVLKDVKHIPSVRLNLLSVGKLCGEKYDSLFSGDTWKLCKGVMVLARGKQHSNLYLTRAKVIRDSVNAVESNDRIIESDDKTELWHRRLSHISEKGLDCLAKKNVLHGVKRAKLEKCAHCFAGKQRRVSFAKAVMWYSWRIRLLTTLQRQRSRNFKIMVTFHFDPIPLSDQNENVVQNDYQDEHNDPQGVGATNDAPMSEVVDDRQQDTPTVAPEAPLKRSTRNRQPFTRFSSNEYVLLIDGGEPETYEKAMRSYQRRKWLDAMEDEMKPLQDNHTFELSDFQFMLPSSSYSVRTAASVFGVILFLLLLFCQE